MRVRTKRKVVDSPGVTALEPPANRVKAEVAGGGETKDPPTSKVSRQVHWQGQLVNRDASDDARVARNRRVGHRSETLNLLCLDNPPCAAQTFFREIYTPTLAIVHSFPLKAHGISGQGELVTSGW